MTASVLVSLLMGGVALAVLTLVAQEANQRLNLANGQLADTNQKLKSLNVELGQTNASIANANRELTEAVRREKLATTAAGDNLYTAHMNLVHQAWERAEVEKVRLLLLGQTPKQGEPDRRSFEWFYYWNELHSEFATIDGLPGPVRALSYSSDGRWLAIASEIEWDKGKILLWDTTSEQPPKVIADFKIIPYAMAFQPGGEWLAYTSGDKRNREVTLHHVGTGEIKKLRGHTQPVLSLAFSPDDTFTASSISPKKSYGCASLRGRAKPVQDSFRYRVKC